MNEPPKKDALWSELETERSIRRAASLLQAKRARIRDDLDCSIAHLALLLPQSPRTATEGASSDLLIEAARRLDDDIFTELLMQIIEERKSF